MLARLATAVVRRRVLVLIATFVALAVAGVFGGDVATRLSSGGFDDPGAESVAADRALTEQFRSGQPNLVLLVTVKEGGVDAAAATAAGRKLTEELGAEPGISTAVSYWSLGAPPPLRSADSRQALVLARIDGDEDAVNHRIETLSPAYTRSDGVLDVRVGGQAEVFRQVGTTVEEDLKRAEMVALPITMILLVLVFGSVVAAALPLAIGAIAVLGTFLTLRLLLEVTDVSIFSLNLTTALGLGLAIDYSLFIVNRYREEVRAGRAPHDAVVESVRTAGRTVVFSALTVAVSLAALLVFPLYFLRSFAYAGIAVVTLAAVGAVIVLPALLAVLGRRVDSLRLWRGRPRHTDEGSGFWHRVAVTVMRRPIGVATAVIVLLLLLGAPFLGVQFGLPDDRSLPADTSSHQVQDEIRRGFTSSEADALVVVAPTAGPAEASRTEVSAYAEQLSRLPDVARVDASTGSYADGRKVSEPNPASGRFSNATGTWLSVIPAVEALSPEGEGLVQAVRAAPAPWDVHVGGPSANLVDSKAAIFGGVPLAGVIIAIVTFVVLFMMTGSLLVPVKAVVLNLLSLTATFGAMVWVFQQGHLSGLLDFTATGTLDTSTPILMFCIAFGLSMDYEVFLLSRIKEEHDRGADNTAAVALGLERTGRIVTAAALLLAVVFAAFATSGISFIKMMGVGLTLAVLMDATLVRGALVPAFMRLAGDANWWAPAPLRRFHDRFGLREATADRTGALDAADVVPTAVGSSS